MGTRKGGSGGEQFRASCQISRESRSLTRVGEEPECIVVPTHTTVLDTNHYFGKGRPTTSRCKGAEGLPKHLTPALITAQGSSGPAGLRGYLRLLTTRRQLSSEEGGYCRGAVVALGTRLDTLTQALDTLNSTLVTHSTHSTDNTHRIQSLEQWTNLVTNLSSRMSEVETWQSGRPDTSQLANLTAALSQLKDTSQRHARTLSNITQSVDVVKGVEGKLEGSQVQLANTVSELKQQFQKVEQQVLSMALATSASTSPPLPPSNETHTRKQRLSQSNPGGGGRDSRGP
ncbi:hypothetical protein Pcinc_025527 [Petrolisthes cinctipes]|uniref:Uncharacterized protein n=1 Tax=Petrolisthes cinctipes TaxID=88211 RepID=A0AAE1KCX3_PETCI|nr:hypothetical protein Pcinc_025527 [Petrolisthes cinctipes]